MKYKQYEKEISGNAADTTNNRMELMAVIQGFKSLKSSSLPVTVHTDSRYVCDGWNSWLEGWVKKNWRNSKRQEVQNRDLWEELLGFKRKFELEKRAVTFTWVKGHNGHPENERADQLATSAIWATPSTV